MTHAIAVCVNQGEIKNMRDKVRAIEEYARQAKDVEQESQAARVRLRAEKRWAELYHDGEKAKGSSGNQYTGDLDRSPDTTSPTLSNMGVSKDQSSRWQKLAHIPDDEFEEMINRPGIVPSTTGVINEYEGLTIADLNLPNTTDAAFWLASTLSQFEENGYADSEIDQEIATMTAGMQRDVERLLPRLITWLRG